ncbi:Succinylglutamate desuccinylase / Aspartoacylase family protein [Planctomycetes bacterium Poly30]|uniref:Succinylglutamate desuccinylase / Aspartoacylase family protein n=1 Tax=Saltatorellus ferox TaxID=2528018 RepID=A0A518EZX0_9BACT|nr:Succinylglutamate desuccinylase / Aspartoacylase family protein [Planctomycetes bacterium Poly30]
MPKERSEKSKAETNVPARSKSKAKIKEPERPPFEMAGETIQAGKRLRFELPIARLQTDAVASLPVCVIHGVNPGPTIWTNAAIHGDELNGVEVIRRVLLALDAKEMSGTLIAVPIVNVFGFLNQSRYLPDRRDLNRSFPGSARGSLATRLAHIFVTEIVERCTLGIDLHTGSDARTNLPQVRADVADPLTLELAHAFAAPVTLAASLRDGSLRKVARRRGARVLLYEAGEPLRFGNDAIERGVSGILRVLQKLEMITEAPEPDRPTVIAHASRWVRALRSGLYHSQQELGASVERGQTLGFVTTPYDGKRTLVKSPCDGVVIGHVTNPLVFQGDALVHVAEIGRHGHVAFGDSDRGEES